MSQWERTFEVSVPVERVWKAFTEETELLMGAPEQRRSETKQLERNLKVLEVVPNERLRWEQSGPELPSRSEFTVTFESTESGSRFTVTRAGFGDGEVAEIFGKSFELGFTHGLIDMLIYLETGQFVKRHYDGCAFSSLGVMYDERDWGLEVRDVKPGTFGEQAGLQTGDRLLSLGETPVYKRTDLWTLMATHHPGTELEVDFIRGRERMQGRGKLSSGVERAWGE